MEGPGASWLDDKDDDKCLRREKRICTAEVWGTLLASRVSVLHNTHPKRFFRVAHETDEHVCIDVEPLPNPGTNDLFPSIGSGHQHFGIYDRREDTIESIDALEKDVRIPDALCDIKKVNERIQRCSLRHSLEQETFEMLYVRKVIMLLGSDLAFFSWRK